MADEAMTAGEYLATLRNVDGSPRFYPDGEHPACARNRIVYAELRRVRSMAGRHLERHRLVDLDRAIDFQRQMIEAVEVPEAEEKLRAIGEWIARG